MRVPRIFIDMPLEDLATVRLPADAERHVRTVLKRKPGEPLILFNGQGGEYPGMLERHDGGGVSVVLTERQDVDRELHPQIAVWQVICRGGRMDYLIEKATELGVHEIVPMMSKRSVVQLTGKRASQRQAHWQGIARAASEQSGRTRVPEVAAPCKLGAWLAAAPDGARFVLDPTATIGLAARFAAPDNIPDQLTLIVGPEGGFESVEIEQMTAHGCEALALGPRVLRADTAALSAISMLQALAARGDS